MTNPREMAEFFGFTEEEVQELCKEYGRSFEETQAWYDGYELTTMSGNELKTYAMYKPQICSGCYVERNFRQLLEQDGDI